MEAWVHTRHNTTPAMPTCLFPLIFSIFCARHNTTPPLPTCLSPLHYFIFLTWWQCIKVVIQNCNLGPCKAQHHTDNANMSFPIDLYFWLHGHAKKCCTQFQNPHLDARVHASHTDNATCLFPLFLAFGFMAM